MGNTIAPQTGGMFPSLPNEVNSEILSYLNYDEHHNVQKMSRHSSQFKSTFDTFLNSDLRRKGQYINYLCSLPTHEHVIQADKYFRVFYKAVRDKERNDTIHQIERFWKWMWKHCSKACEKFVDMYKNDLRRMYPASKYILDNFKEHATNPNPNLRWVEDNPERFFAYALQVNEYASADVQGFYYLNRHELPAAWSRFSKILGCHTRFKGRQSQGL